MFREICGDWVREREREKKERESLRLGSSVYGIGPPDVVHQRITAREEEEG